MEIRYFFILLAIALLSGCKNEQKQLLTAIETMEKSIDEAPSSENAQALVEKYQAYVAQFPDDIDQNSRYLYRAAALDYRMNRFSAALLHLEQAVKDFYESENTALCCLFMGDLYQENLRNEECARTTYQALIQAFPDSESAAKAKEKIAVSLPSMDERLNVLYTTTYNDSTKRIEYRTANNYITSSELYAMILPQSERAPEYLHQAGETARSIRSFDKALELYQWILERYPDYEKAPQALFLSAFTLENDLQRLEEAKALYEQFLKKYPNDDFADDAKVLLDNLGKDEAEIIKSFEQQ
ncbi:MAG TPA: tetratricopeptide repeat protein [Saprospiraceae bacterium]|nr:tetratricopeptide repeat protein [Saprospiraceae bacterium]HMQ83368.1 tetratricopeptide repeat protein [Saprospiraceae bacterium]